VSATPPSIVIVALVLGGPERVRVVLSSSRMTTRLVAALVGALCLASAAKTVAEEPLLALTDANLLEAIAEHKLMLLSIGIEGCVPCEVQEQMLLRAKKDIRVKSSGTVTLAKYTIISQDSPAIGTIVGGALTIPKLIIFREGEAMDFDGEVSKTGVVEVMLREMSRDTVQTLKSVKQTERFLHLDSWSAQHSEEEQPPRVVGFFPSNQTKGYGVFRSMACKLQGMIAFGEVFDPALQKKFLGAPAKKSVVRIVKADKKERTLTYSGPLAVPPMARWVATHSLAVVQDLTTESSIEAHMARGVPVFLLLMPDDYEDSLSDILKVFKSVAARVRERILFAYGFKDTEPWPQFAQSLGIERESTGAYWMIVGNGYEATGRNWSTAWLKPPSLGFTIYAMEARGGEKPEHVTEKKVNKFVDGFLAQVDAMVPPDEHVGVVEDELDAVQSAEGGGAEGAEGGSDAASEGAAEAERRKAEAANYDKELRKLIAALEMSFNSGVANIKKGLDDVKDTPAVLPGRIPGLTSTLASMELKVKKGITDLKAKMREVGSKKDEL